MTFDMDYTMGAGWGDVGPNADNFRNLETRSGLSPTNLFIALYRNDEFKKRFANIFCDYVNEIMNIDKIIPMVAKYKEENSDLVGYSQLRWWGGEKEQGYMHWKQNYLSVMDKIQQFFELRPQFALNHIKQHLQLKGELNELTIITSQKDKIQINTIIPNIKNGAWTGKYFSDIPITLSVVNSDSFKGWSGDIESNEKSITITLSKSMKIQANF